MDIRTRVTPKREIKPTIYAYITPTNTAKEGWIKIGYTDRDADTRIKEQTHTAGIKAKKLWEHEARFNGGDYFYDFDFHAYIKKQGIENEKGTEWFYFNGYPEKADDLFRSFVFQDYSQFQKGEDTPYQLRTEQEEAVNKTLSFAEGHKGGEFLWNAKPRFGKTLSTYDLIRRLDAENVLIVTNRPAIANSWYDDFEKFIASKTEYKFVSNSDSLKDRPTLSRDEFTTHLVKNNPDARQIAFLSLQDLRGSEYFGGELKKLEWVKGISWDLLVIDEAHEGVDTFKTDIVFENIKRDFTLHLSGTPFKAIAKGSFSEDQIFNWSYADEQEAKTNWIAEESNPYATLPCLNMFTYQMSKMIADQINEGALIGEREVDFAFDLNEFFATKDNGDFEHESDIRKWLETLTTNEKYPFSTPELRNELKHTFWVLNRVDSVKALEKLLREHKTFSEYKVIIAAGDGRSDFDDIIVNNDSSLMKVKEAILNYDKTITLSVGQLTTGVTIPEWTAVLMLSNMHSPALYMQSAFRAQNPNVWTENDNGQEKRYQKENAYVFDFAPERTLVIFDEFANNLLTHTSMGGGTSSDREYNIRRLLNFFPVIGEDNEGKMTELDASQVLTIPRRIKATEVVRRGFMSNLLFANISGIFRAPQMALDILDKLSVEAQGRLKPKENTIDLQSVQVDEDGNATVVDEIIINNSNAIFGSKIYDADAIISGIPFEVGENISTTKIAKNIGTAVVSSLSESLSNIHETYKLTNNEAKRVQNRIGVEVEKTVIKTAVDFNIKKADIDNEYELKLQNTTSNEEREEVESEWTSSLKKTVEEFQTQITEEVSKTVEAMKVDIVREQETKKETKKKKMIEEDVRSHLRGFARSIPSFIMAYGKEDLTLANFDTYVPPSVFEDVTGITLPEFIFLRDGGEYVEDNETKHFDGKLFDEVVFNESVMEFLKKKTELSDYFVEQSEDIFDYIPPQKTNQIYTPKNVVKMMVDELEKENPNIYDDSSKTFIDLYMKSGLYITELVKKLYNSKALQKKFPDNQLRIKHILENQVYGFAPSEIIYKIATNFIFGELDDSISRNNFVLADTTPHVKNGTLQELIDEKFLKD